MGRDYNQLMTVKGFKITREGPIPLCLAASTLDELTGEIPEGLYTTFTTNSRGTRVLGLADHLKRLYAPARELGLRLAVEEGRLRAQIAALAESNLPHESRIRLILTRDTGEFFAGIQPFRSLSTSVYTRGVHVITSDLSRSAPRIKDSAFIAASANQRSLIKGEIFEVLLTRRGRILEGMTSNYYALRGGTLITARRGILLGVTRKAILRLAGGQGMHIVYRAPALHEKIDEAFLTSSSRGVVPIVSIDLMTVGEGKVGRRTKSLSEAYRDYVKERSELLISK